MSEPDEADHVVTAFLRNRGELLLLKRSDAVGTYPGRWGGVSGFAEGDPDAQVRNEIREETGLDPGEQCTFVRSGRPIEFEDPDLGRRWAVHPYLFDCDSRSVELSHEHVDSAWEPPTVVATGEHWLDSAEDAPEARSPDDPVESIETVPKQWAAYERVAPTVRSIAADDAHGAAFLSIRALEVLRDRAGLLVREREASGSGASSEAVSEPSRLEEVSGSGASSGADAGEPDRAAEWEELAALARRLLEARPAMAVLANRVNRAMAGADEGDGVRDARTVLESTIAGIECAVEADATAAERASEYASGRVLTLSRSGTVCEALRVAEPERLFVAESRPAREGVGLAEHLAGSVPVTIHTDAATAHLLSRESIDAVLVGADTVLPDGRVVNKTGTRATAIAADREGVPVYAVAASDKVSTRAEVTLESAGRSAIYDGDAALDVANPTFDVTPADCVTGVVTERGVLDREAIGNIADDLRTSEAWWSGR